MSMDCPEGWWRLREFIVNKAIIPVIPGTKVTALFSGNRVDGSGGCNFYDANYVKKLPHSISIVDLRHTLMYCEAPDIMEQEKRYFQGLVSVQKCELKGDELWLTWEEGQRALVYVPEEFESFQGTR